MPHISTYYNIKKCAFLEYRLLSIYSTQDFTYMIFITHYIECPMTFLDVILLWNIGQCILAAIRAPPFLKCIKTKHCFLWNNGMCCSSNNVFLDVATGMEGIGTSYVNCLIYIHCSQNFGDCLYIYTPFSVLTQNTSFRTCHLQDAHLIE